MPTTVVFANKQAEQEFWNNYQAQQKSNQTTFSLDEEEIRFIKRATRTAFHPLSLFTKFAQGATAPSRTSPQEVPAFKSPLEDVTLYGVATIDLNDYDNDYSGMLKMQKLSKYHDSVIDEAMYDHWDDSTIEAIIITTANPTR